MMRSMIQAKSYFKFFLSIFFAVALSTSISAKPSWKDPTTTDSTSPMGETSSPNKGKGGKAKNTASSAELIVSELPSSLSIQEGGNASFYIAAAMSDGSTINFQWLFNGDPIIGATDNMLSIDFVTLNDQGIYSVKLTSSLGSKQYDASLSVDTIEPVSDMSIIQQPNAIHGKEGDQQRLLIEASSSRDISYQWRKNGINLAGETSSSLNFSNLNLEDAGQYDVVLNDGISTLVSAVSEVTVAPLLSKTISLSWDIPSEREDGSYLSIEEISGYQIYVELTDAMIQESLWVNGEQNSLILSDMPSGSYRFAIATVDIDGAQGKTSDWITLQIN